MTLKEQDVIDSACDLAKYAPGTTKFNIRFALLTSAVQCLEYENKLKKGSTGVRTETHETNNAEDQKH